jgi:predicted house-cleaning NTP pyrophosphatase (Maf/HAM1 superfamily)
LTSRGRRFRHHHAAVHTDRGENHDPTGTLITAQALNRGLDHLARNKRTRANDFRELSQTELENYLKKRGDIAKDGKAADAMPLIRLVATRTMSL